MAEHLGGWLVQGDPATWLPSVWEWAIRDLDVESVIDVGCGDGRAIDWFSEHGCRALGVEGTPQAHPRIIQHDYTLGPYAPNESWDLAWCCEFVEHVDEEYVPNFIETFQAARFILMTHGEPGQPGHHHVNCQTSTYWIDALTASGFEYDPGLTWAARLAARANNFTWADPDGTIRRNHFLRSGLAFRRA